MTPDKTRPLAEQMPPPAAELQTPQGRPRRSAFLTTLGWFFIAAGGMATPVSVMSSLMIIAGSHGSAGGTFWGGLIVICGPPATLIAGVGLLRRQRWAYGYAIGLLIVLAGYSLMQMLRGSKPERSTVSPDGVIHTVLASNIDYPLHILVVAICVGLLVKLLAPATRTQFSP